MGPDLEDPSEYVTEMFYSTTNENFSPSIIRCIKFTSLCDSCEFLLATTADGRIISSIFDPEVAESVGEEQKDV